MARGGDIAIACCLDENYLRPMEVLATSIAWHSAGRRRILIHVFYTGARSPISERLAGFRRGNVRVQLHYLPDNPWAGAPASDRLPVVTYLRLSLPRLLPDLDRLIYLDVDMVAVADIAPLFDVDLGGRPLGAVIDIGLIAIRAEGKMLRGGAYEGSADRFLADVLELSNPNGYVNAGVLLMDLAALRAEHFTERAFALAEQKGERFRFKDQDIINVLMQGRITHLAAGWNLLAQCLLQPRMPALLDGFERDAKAALAHPRIVHFVAKKPWEQRMGRGGHIWWRYADLSPAGRELRAAQRHAIVYPVVAPPPWWSRWAGPVTTLRHILARARRAVSPRRGRAT